ncbi:sugar kinase [Shewanella intestini]|uniref:Sugar kinase n=1 Tax=Shewanella intestini TaxID=2017544 RepID=A0ABS5I4H0_9GAMM|nr:MULTISPECIES: sugar kinase [Shewanella]MBR9728923.1 sugar kinase [Shewanella intestini]MRG37011.1 sugar kinase [Shewanella sp. XMDDZSB0408]
MSMLNVGIIGECMVELQQRDGSLAQNYGGDTLNTAVYLSRLSKGKDMSISYFTALGQDFFSKEMLKIWQQEGIDTQHVQIMDNKLPGLYAIEVDETGERSFHYWRNDAAAKFWLEQASSQLLATLSQFDVLYLSGISLAILTEQSRAVLFDVLKQCKANGGKVVFDNNYRPRLWRDAAQAKAVYLEMLALTDIGLLTFEDEEVLFGDTEIAQCLDRSFTLGLSEVVIKRGAQECIVATKDSQISVPATHVDNVVDTTSAGDSFAAGYMSERLLGHDATLAAKTGHALAGIVIQHKGAIIDLAAMPSQV